MDNSVPLKYALLISHWSYRPFNSTHYIVLYLQNGDHIVTIDIVTSLHPVYKRRLHLSIASFSIRWHLLYYAHKLDAQRINIKWWAWPQAAVAQAWEPAQG